MLGAIENFHFIFTAITSQRSSGGISFMYALHARTLLASSDANPRGKVLGDLKNKLRGILPAYAEFESNFLELQFSRSFTKQKKLIQYVLSKVDRVISGSGVVLDYSQMTIEHLAPQSPGAGSGLGESVIGSIGNLLLVEKGFNSNELANKNFPVKKAILQKSKVFLDPVIVGASVWTKDEI